MNEVEAKDLVNYIGKKFLYESNIFGFEMGQKVRAEGILVSIETYTSDFGYGDHVVTYMNIDGELDEFLVFGPEKFLLMN